MSDHIWRGLLLASGAMLLLLGLLVPFTDRSSSTFVIIVLGAIHLLVAMAILGALLYFDWDPFEPFKN